MLSFNQHVSVIESWEIERIAQMKNGKKSKRKLPTAIILNSCPHIKDAKKVGKRGSIACSAKNGNFVPICNGICVSQNCTFA